MFTGIVEAVGKVRQVERTPFGLRLSIAVPAAWELKTGESVAVDGVCLTVTRSGSGEASFDAAPATLRKTTLGSWRTGTAVNLERALRADARLGGHMVSGHVEGTARLIRSKPSGGACVWELEAPAGLAAGIVAQGSVTLDGVSLTAASVRGRRFEVCLIPQTLKDTTLGARRAGAPLNLETDLLARYARPERKGGITEGFLREHGFLG